MIRLDDLVNIPILASLAKEILSAIAERAFPRKLHTGDILLFEGDLAESCYFIISGHLRVLRMNPDGRVQVLARLTPGSPINIISVLSKEKTNQATVEALTPVQVLVLTSADFEFLLKNFPDFSRILLQVFVERLKNMTQLAAGLSLYTVRARLAQFLINLGDEPGATCGWTQDEIAAQIGTVREVVGRLLREFEDQGLIKRDHHKILLMDRKGLSETAVQIN